MTPIRENIFHVTYADLGRPTDTGYYDVEELGPVMLDEADVRYIRECGQRGYDPGFFVSRTPALKGALVVVSRQWPS